MTDATKSLEGLLQLIADPKGAKVLLDELRPAIREHADQLESLKQTAANLRAEREANDARKGELDHFERQLTANEKKYEADRAYLNEQLAEIARIKEEAQGRLDQVVARENNLAARKAEFEGVLSKLK